jgi:hypothetical protein
VWVPKKLTPKKKKKKKKPNQRLEKNIRIPGLETFLGGTGPTRSIPKA